MLANYFVSFHILEAILLILAGSNLSITSPLPALAAGALWGLGGTAVMSVGSGGFDCMFNYAAKSGCKGSRKIKEEEQRQTGILIDNLMAADRMSQKDTTYKIQTNSVVNQNYLNNANALNGFQIQSGQMLNNLANNFATTQGSQVLENIQANRALESKVVNNGQNNLKDITDLAVNLRDPKQYSQSEYDHMFSS